MDFHMVVPVVRAESVLGDMAIDDPSAVSVVVTAADIPATSYKINHTITTITITGLHTRTRIRSLLTLNGPNLQEN